MLLSDSISVEVLCYEVLTVMETAENFKIYKRITQNVASFVNKTICMVLIDDSYMNWHDTQYMDCNLCTSVLNKAIHCLLIPEMIKSRCFVAYKSLLKKSFKNVILKKNSVIRKMTSV